jgi:hypothetical protein
MCNTWSVGFSETVIVPAFYLRFQERTSVCVCVCKSAIALYLHVIKRTCKQGANKSSHPN